MQLLLSSAVNASIADGTGIGTITNDDGNPSIAIADTAVIEGNSGPSSAALVVTLSNPVAASAPAASRRVSSTPVMFLGIVLCRVMIDREDVR